MSFEEKHKKHKLQSTDKQIFLHFDPTVLYYMSIPDLINQKATILTIQTYSVALGQRNPNCSSVLQNRSIEMATALFCEVAKVLLA